MMWLGGSSRSWMMYSPRSVSIGLTPVLFEELVDADFLADHRLALGDRARAGLPADRQHGLSRRFGIGAPVHLAAGFDDLGFEALEVEIEMFEGVVLDRLAGVAKRLELRHPGHGAAAFDREALAEAGQRLLQLDVRHGAMRVVGKDARGRLHGASPPALGRRLTSCFVRLQHSAGGQAPFRRASRSAASRRSSRPAPRRRGGPARSRRAGAVGRRC